MTAFWFDKWLDHCITCVQKMGRNMSRDDCYLLVMDGHASFVIVDVVKNAKVIELHLITLPSHTSHTLQPLCLAFNLLL